MKPLHTKIKVLALLLIISGCNSETAVSRDFFELHPIDTVMIKLAKNSPFESRHIAVYSNGKEQTLLFYNANSNSIDKYSIENKTFIGSVFLGNGEIDGFYYVNDDSIYVIPKFTCQVILVSKAGQQLASLNLENDKEKFLLYSSFKNPIIKQSDYLIISRKPVLEKAEDIPKVDHEVKFSFSQEQYSTLGTFPIPYRQGKWWHFAGYETSKTINNQGQIVISYPVSHEIATYDIESTSQKTFLLKSKFLDGYEFPCFDNNQRKDPLYKIEYVATLGRYFEIMYDPYRNLYYRLVAHPQKYYNEDETTNSHSDREWSVLVADKDFNLLFEQKFEAKKFNFNNVLVTKEGLLVSNNHSLNPNFNPDVLSFTLFGIK